MIVELEEEMLAAADDLRFEEAARIRDELKELRARPRRDARVGGRVTTASARSQEHPDELRQCAEDQAVINNTVSATAEIFRTQIKQAIATW